MELTTVTPEQFGIEQQKANELIGNLPQIQMERQVLETQYEEIIKLDIDDPGTTKLAKYLRLQIKDNRTKGIQVWHKTSKEVFLRAGQFIDALKNREIAINERMEEALEKIEKHFEIKEAERKAELRSVRNKHLEPFLEFVPFGIDFGNVSEEEYLKIYNGSKLQYEAKLEQERKEEKERIKQQKIQEKLEAEQRAEQERIRVENEKLKAEAEEKEKELAKRNELLMPYIRYIRDYNKVLSMDEKDFQQELKNLNKEAVETIKFEADQELKRQKEIKAEQEKQAKIRAEAEGKLKAEREARAKLEAELQAKKDAEEKAEQLRLAEIEKQKQEAEKLSKAGEKVQLTSWIDSFEKITIPEHLKDSEVANDILSKYWAFNSWAKKQIENF